MKSSVKANLIVFLIIAVIAFCISSAFATLTIHEDNDSYKLIPLSNDSFEPDEVDYVPTYVPKNTTNTTNTTDTNDTDDSFNTTEFIGDIGNTLDNWSSNFEEWTDNYEDEED